MSIMTVSVPCVVVFSRCAAHRRLPSEPNAESLVRMQSFSRVAVKDLDLSYHVMAMNRVLSSHTDLKT